LNSGFEIASANAIVITRNAIVVSATQSCSLLVALIARQKNIAAIGDDRASIIKIKLMIILFMFILG
jgi:hypothetical protein